MGMCMGLECVDMFKCGFCNIWMCVYVGFVMRGCVYVWVFYCLDVRICGFFNVWMCVYVGFVIFGCVCVCVCVCVYGFCNALLFW